VEMLGRASMWKPEVPGWWETPNTFLGGGYQLTVNNGCPGNNNVNWILMNLFLIKFDEFIFIPGRPWRSWQSCPILDVHSRMSKNWSRPKITAGCLIFWHHQIHIFKACT
jgi:hypothetical protein